MANDRLRDAMTRQNVSIRELASLTEKDPKTVGRWLGGRVPHPRVRFAVAKRLKSDEEYLWPGANRQQRDPTTAAGEVIASYPYRSDVPKTGWWELIDKAQNQIDLLGYTLYFLPYDLPGFIGAIEAKCAAGCRIRAVMADPKSTYVTDRDKEEGLAMTLAVRIQTSLHYFEPLLKLDGFELRYQDVPLYNSVFRFDDEMFVTPHLYATPGSSAPLLHLRRLGPNGLFSRFAGHFEGIWAKTTPEPRSP